MKGVSGQVLLSPCLTKIPVFNANSVEPDQTLGSVAADFELHCLLQSLGLGINGLG